MITQEELQELRDTYLDNIKTSMLGSGGLEPHITVFAEHKETPVNEEAKNAIIHMPIPSKFMKDDQGKQDFVDEVIPQVAKKINKTFLPAAVAWAAEAWVRHAPLGTNFDETNYKDLPIDKEILIVTFESADFNEVTIYDIKRQGKQINKDGELVDHIELVPDESMKGAEYPQGRFTGLYKKFTACS